MARAAAGAPQQNVTNRDPKGWRDPAALTAFIRAHQVARLFLPVVMLHALAAHPERIPTSVALIATAGEQLRMTVPVRAWCRQSPFAIDNQYGPTEAWSIAPATGSSVAGTGG